MARQPELSTLMDHVQPLETWIWPLTAAIVIGGALVFSSVAGMFWLAMHPTQQSTVIWMQPATSQASDMEQSVASNTTTALENRPDARTN
jgi:hypothetical protein